MSDETLFERRTGRVLAAVFVAGLGATLFFTVFGGDPLEDVAAPPVGADSFSRSALGHRALVRLLEAELPVLVSRGYSVAKAGPDRPLLLLEPVPYAELGEHFIGLVDEAAKGGIPVVVTLPKWSGERDDDRPTWIESAAVLPPEVPRMVLERALHSSEQAHGVRRPARATGWSSALPGGATPDLPRPQLMAPSLAFEPLVEADQGVLVARVGDDPPIVLVADPDLLNNAGLARPANAVVVHRLLVDELGARALIVDESLHGYPPPETLWQALLRFPLLCFSLQLAALAALAVWAGGGRLGRALPPPSRLPPGKWTLLDNTARLLALGRRPGSAAERYFGLAVERAAAAFHLPPGLDPETRLSELHRLGRARGVARGIAGLRAELREVVARPEPRRVVALGRDLHRWHQEIVDAPRNA